MTKKSTSGAVAESTKKPAGGKAAADAKSKPSAKKPADKPAAEKSAAKPSKPAAGKSAPAKAPAKPSAPAKDVPKKSSPKVEAPKKDAGKKETSKKDAPAKGAPKPGTKDGATATPDAAAAAGGGSAVPSTNGAAGAPGGGGPAASAGGAAGAGGGPKGITIVNNNKTIKKNKPKPKIEFPVYEPLLKPGSKWKPLIPSGPQAAQASGPLTAEQVQANRDKAPKMPKKELEKYRQILLRKRSELVGDISNMEEEALRQSTSGSLSSLPQHMAEQGSDTFDQSLSLDLAQVDRKLLKEIDAALERIDQGIYGVCELTGVPIKPERLEELPWARYSIEAAREVERRPGFSQTRAVQYESESE